MKKYLIKSRMTMPFGRFQGKPVEQLPLSYLQWCLSNVKLHDNLKGEMHRVIKIHHTYETQAANPLFFEET